MTLNPRTPQGTLSPTEVVRLPKGITEVAASPKGQVTAIVSSQVSSAAPLLDLVQAVDLLALPPPEWNKVRSLLRQYETVFSAHSDDLECTNLTEHEFPLLDEVPVHQRFRRIHPLRV